MSWPELLVACFLLAGIAGMIWWVRRSIPNPPMPMYTVLEITEYTTRVQCLNCKSDPATLPLFKAGPDQHAEPIFTSMRHDCRTGQWIIHPTADAR